MNANQRKRRHSENLLKHRLRLRASSFAPRDAHVVRRDSVSPRRDGSMGLRGHRSNMEMTVHKRIPSSRKLNFASC